MGLSRSIYRNTEWRLCSECVGTEAVRSGGISTCVLRQSLRAPSDVGSILGGGGGNKVNVCVVGAS